MMCYRDMTFCSEKTCNHFGDGCHRSLTESVREAANEWWGDPEGSAPIAQFIGKPQCFEEQI